MAKYVVRTISTKEVKFETDLIHCALGFAYGWNHYGRSDQREILVEVLDGYLKKYKS